MEKYSSRNNSLGRFIFFIIVVMTAIITTIKAANHRFLYNLPFSSS